MKLKRTVLLATCFVAMGLLLGASAAQDNVGFLPAVNLLLLLEDEPSANVVQFFVTSDTFDGNLGGLTGADAKCTAAASAAGLGGNWAAWLSDNAVNARQRIPDGEYRLLDGTVVANDRADLTDGTLNAPIDLDENLGTGGPQVFQVFVTSDTFDGNLGGLAGADAKCTAAASAAGLGGNWTAWLSDNAVNARQRIPDGEYRLLDGTVVANDRADLTDGTLDAAINLDEEQSEVTTTDVWTATAADGTNTGYGSCESWSTIDNSKRGRVGRPTRDDAFWTDLGGGSPCDSTRRLYCFSSGPSSEVWTSTAADGTNQGFGSCVNWSTVDDTKTGRVGESTAVDATWTSLGGRTCDLERRLYCYHLNAPPLADFSFTTDGYNVDFTDLSDDSDGTVVAWSWDFGDSNTSTEQNPSHTYATEGSYDVSLTVTDDQGAESEQVTKSVAVSAPPNGDVVRVFITSGVFQGNLGGLTGADQKCQAAADAANLGGVWTAWLSDENNDAVDRIPDGQYRLLNGDLVAFNKFHLTSTDTILPLANPIILSELGDLKASSTVWTGTQWDGTSIPPSTFGDISNCENWTNSNQQLGCSNGDPDCGNFGFSGSVEKEWTLGISPGDPFLGGCNIFASLYCFGSQAVSE